MISTLYDGERVPYAIQYLKPDKIYFLMDDNPERTAAYEKMQDFFGLKKEIKSIVVKIHKIYEISKQVFDVIQKESREGKEIVVTISEGMKPMALGAMFAAYADNDKVEGIYYVMHGTQELIRYPLLNINVRNGKKKVLEAINELSKINKEIKIQDIEKKASLVKSTVYDNLSDLKKEGFIDRISLKITDFGRIALLKK